MTTIGVILTAIAILFLLTTMALRAGEQLTRPYPVTAGLVALLALGLALLFE